MGLQGVNWKGRHPFFLRGTVDFGPISAVGEQSATVSFGSNVFKEYPDVPTVLVTIQDLAITPVAGATPAVGDLEIDNVRVENITNEGFTVKFAVLTLNTTTIASVSLKVAWVAVE